VLLHGCTYSTRFESIYLAVSVLRNVSYRLFFTLVPCFIQNEWSYTSNPNTPFWCGVHLKHRTSLPLPHSDHGFISRYGTQEAEYFMVVFTYIQLRYHRCAMNKGAFLRETKHDDVMYGSMLCDALQVPSPHLNSPHLSPSISSQWFAVPIGVIMGAHDKFLCIHKNKTR
jgi:hypothetical protein